MLVAGVITAALVAVGVWLFNDDNVTVPARTTVTLTDSEPGVWELRGPLATFQITHSDGRSGGRGQSWVDPDQFAGLSLAERIDAEATVRRGVVRAGDTVVIANIGGADATWEWVKE
jgi:hypothetical protein